MKKLFCLLVITLLASPIQARWIFLTGNQKEKSPRFEVLSSSHQRTVVEFNLTGLYVNDTTVQHIQPVADAQVCVIPLQDIVKTVITH
ncbi:MAG: hypothetical protein K6T77_00110 [candidate division WOR-3 bacterium]|jgi:hypothetical protein|nr:hypothetical protein [candidate division WOR-3 bacterium]MCR4424501.1 hypothetical protein [candidate division WOR-3 bacterium]MDH7519651.1 hypothetical protein [bacterium]